MKRGSEDIRCKLKPQWHTISYCYDGYNLKIISGKDRERRTLMHG